MIFQIVLTEDCNLACKYCYIKNRKSYMTKEDIDLLIQNINFILEEYGTQNYGISYYGGEPLLNWEVLKYAYYKFSQDCRVYQQSITSNLSLIDKEKLEFLTNNNITLIWSFDGLWQNENRPLRNSYSSYDIYLQKKELIEKLKINRLSVTVRPENISEMTKNLEWIIDNWKIFPTYNTAIDTVWTEEDINLFDKEIVNLCNKYVQLTKQNIPALQNSIFLNTLQNILVTEKNGYRPFSCGAGTSQLAFLPDKIVYPCAMFGNNKKILLWDFKNKNVFYQNINFVKNLHKINLDSYKECSNCNISSYCYAGCAYLNLYNNDNNINGKIPTYCKMTKIIYRESLRLYDELKNNDLFQKLLRHLKIVVTNNQVHYYV